MIVTTPGSEFELQSADPHDREKNNSLEPLRTAPSPDARDRDHRQLVRLRHAGQVSRLDGQASRAHQTILAGCLGSHRRGQASYQVRDRANSPARGLSNGEIGQRLSLS